MNAQTDNTIANPMQAKEAFPLEDNSLPATKTLAEQQTRSAERFDIARVFVP